MYKNIIITSDDNYEQIYTKIQTLQDQISNLFMNENINQLTSGSSSVVFYNLSIGSI
jgi:hypothetical protein